MVYSSLGDMEEQDEDFYTEQDLLASSDEPQTHSVSPAVAIFLTSILEYMGEQTLVVAGQVAYHRMRLRHEKALAEAKAAADELEKAKKAAEEEAAKLKPSDAPKAPIKFKDAVGRKFSFPWNLCKTWKVSCGQDASALQALT